MQISHHELEHMFGRHIESYLKQRLPDITFASVQVDYTTDMLVLVAHTGEAGHIVELMNRHDLDRSLGRTLSSVGNEMLEKVNRAFNLIEPKNAMADAADEYDEILKAQEAMDKLNA